MFLVGIGVGSGCSSTPGSVTRVAVRNAEFPVALTPDAEGSILYAERLTGRVRRIGRDGSLEPAPVAQVDVATEGEQRGLLGLAADPSGRLFAVFTSASAGSRIDVAELIPTKRVVWHGPASASLANSGHLVYDPNRRRLILGIGDLLEPSKVADPDTPNGELLLVDPDAPETQKPVMLSGGWNNPFAFTLTTDGAVWVADNVPGDRGERLARGDREGRPTAITSLPTNTVPSAVTEATPGRLIVCSYARKRTLAFEVHNGRARRAYGFGDNAPCRTGAATSDNGRTLWLADEQTIRMVVVNGRVRARQVERRARR